MRRLNDYAVLLILLPGLTFLSACGDRSDAVNAQVESMLTDIGPDSCTEQIDEDDPNDTTYQLCPGVSGYSLMLRHVGSGRQSIDVRTPDGVDFPLDYDVYVTRYMLHLDTRAEWRLIEKSGAKIPVALIVRVYAHENEDEPQDVTETYIAVAKIAPGEICVIGRIAEAPQYESKVQDAVNAALTSQCLEPRPQIASDIE